MNHTNLDQITEIEGQPLAKRHLATLKKIHKMGIRPRAEGATRTNPYSGISHQLSPLATTLYDFIINSYQAGMVGRHVPVSLWDSSRHLFLEIWPDQYFDLID
jgi:hypothetical protein